MKTVKITTDNQIRIVDIDFENIRAIQREVGGYIEAVYTTTIREYFQRIGVDEKTILLVDEEGRIKELPRNLFGSILYPGYICGDVLLAKVVGEDIVGVDAPGLVEKRLLEDFKFLRRDDEKE